MYALTLKNINPAKELKIVPCRLKLIIIVSRYDTYPLLASPGSPLVSSLCATSTHIWCKWILAPLLKPAPAPFYVVVGKNNNRCVLPKTYMYVTCVPSLSNHWRGHDIVARAAQGESPCAVAWETPWRGCVSVSLGAAVDAGEEGDGRLRKRKDPRQNQSPVSYTAAYTPL